MVFSKRLLILWSLDGLPWNLDSLPAMKGTTYNRTLKKCCFFDEGLAEVRFPLDLDKSEHGIYWGDPNVEAIGEVWFFPIFGCKMGQENGGRVFFPRNTSQR